MQFLLGGPFLFFTYAFFGSMVLVLQDMFVFRAVYVIGSIILAKEFMVVPITHILIVLLSTIAPQFTSS